MTTPESGSAQAQSRFGKVEFLGELVLLLFVGATFVYMLWESRNWGTGAWLLPRITIFFGIPFWFMRVFALFRTQVQSKGTAQIMDMGFLTTQDSLAVITRRWVTLIATTGGLLAGVWVLGFHIGIPLYVVLYLTFLGKVKWWITLFPAAFFWVVIEFLYGRLLLAVWNDPLVFQWFDAIRGVD